MFIENRINPSDDGGVVILIPASLTNKAASVLGPGPRDSHGSQRPSKDRSDQRIHRRAETSGQIRTMWYEFTSEGLMEITEMDSTKYATKRQQ